MSNKVIDDSWFEKQPQFFGHPIGLFILFLTEMWERFSYYGMRAILVLYLTAETMGDNPGYGWTDPEALALYGWYTMFVYLASIPGGILADRYIGQKRAVMLGGLLLCAGHGILAVDQLWAFYTGLILIVSGVGCLKPNISTMVGGLYRRGDKRRDMGFYIFYMGINLGAAVAALLVGYIGETIGWHYGFGLAGIGMLIGQITYIAGQKYLKNVGNLIKEEPSGKSGEKLNLIGNIFKKTNSMIGFGIFFAISVVYYILTMDWQYALLFLGIAFAVGIAVVVYNDGRTQVEKDRMLVTFVSFLIIIVFWGAFEQAGGLMNLYTKEKTNLDMGFFEVPASWFQSVNAVFILIFATPIGAFWLWWKNRGKESSGIFKMAIGVIIMGWGFAFMSIASTQVVTEPMMVEETVNGVTEMVEKENVLEKSWMIWLILAYLFHTIGELCASPVALSFITKLAPERWVAFMMGAYFAASGLGNKLAGVIGEKSEVLGEFTIFTGLVVFCTIIGLLIIAILKPLKRLIHGAEDEDPALA